jgi:hypothetical protein
MFILLYLSVTAVWRRRLTEDALLIQSMAYAPAGSIVFDSLDNGRSPSGR